VLDVELSSAMLSSVPGTSDGSSVRSMAFVGRKRETRALACRRPWTISARSRELNRKEMLPPRHVTKNVLSSPRIDTARTSSMSARWKTSLVKAVRLPRPISCCLSAVICRCSAPMRNVTGTSER